MDHISLNEVRIHEHILVYRRKEGRKEGGEVVREERKRKRKYDKEDLNSFKVSPHQKNKNILIIKGKEYS